MATIAAHHRIRHPTRLVRWACAAGLLSALWAGLVVWGWFAVLTHGSPRYPAPVPVALVAAGCVGLCTVVIDGLLLRSAAARQEPVVFGIAAGAACALLPYPIFWFISGLLFGPLIASPFPIVNDVTLFCMSLLLVGPFTIPASLVTTAMLFDRYRARLADERTAQEQPQ